MALDKIKTDVITDDAITIAKMNTDTGVQSEHIKVPVYANDSARNSAIGSPAVGMLIYNTSKGVLQQYNAQGWSSIDSPPTVSSLDYPGSATALNSDGEFTDATCDYNNDPTITHDANTKIKTGMTVKGTGIPTGATVASVTSSTEFELSASTTGGAVTNGTLTFNSEVLVISGTNFQSGVSVTIDNTAVSSLVRNSSTQITVTGVPAKSAGTYADGLKVSNPTGLTASINVDYSATPAWTTNSGTVLSAFQGTISTLDLAATSNSAVTYAVTTGSLPAGLSMATNTGDITGNMTAAKATYNFTVTATDAESQTTPRLFNIISLGQKPTGGSVTTSGLYTIHSFTTVGTAQFVTYNQIAGVEYLMIAGGGEGGQWSSAEGYATGASGGNTTFKVQSAGSNLVHCIGGGGGASHGDADGALDGGSGGGGTANTNIVRYQGGLATANQGYTGGDGKNNPASGGGGQSYPGGGGGGAGSSGQTHSSNTQMGAGGVGIESSITGSAVKRAGGGGAGGWNSFSEVPGLGGAWTGSPATSKTSGSVSGTGSAGGNEQAYGAGNGGSDQAGGYAADNTGSGGGAGDQGSGAGHGGGGARGYQCTVAGEMSGGGQTAYALRAATFSTLGTNGATTTYDCIVGAGGSGQGSYGGNGGSGIIIIRYLTAG